MAGRPIDKRKTNRALRKLQRIAASFDNQEGPALTVWEKDFVKGVAERLETYGSAFRDPAKGRLDEPLSQRQEQTARVIARKARDTGTGRAAGKDSGPWGATSRKGMKRKSPMQPGGKSRRKIPSPDAENDPVADAAQSLRANRLRR